MASAHSPSFPTAQWGGWVLACGPRAGKPGSSARPGDTTPRAVTPPRPHHLRSWLSAAAPLPAVAATEAPCRLPPASPASAGPLVLRTRESAVCAHWAGDRARRASVPPSQGKGRTCPTAGREDQKAGRAKGGWHSAWLLAGTHCLGLMVPTMVLVMSRLPGGHRPDTLACHEYEALPKAFPSREPP